MIPASHIIALANANGFPVATNLTTDFTDKVNLFIKHVNEVLDKHRTSIGATFCDRFLCVPDWITEGYNGPRKARRYIRLMQGYFHNDTGLRSISVHSFIDVTTGEIYKPAGLNKPAMHARGNVNNTDHSKTLTDSGSVIYLR